MNYEKIIKRKIRESKCFKKGNRVNIVGFDTNTFDYTINLIKNLDKKYGLNLKLNIEKIKNLKEIKFLEGFYILIIPAEAVLTQFLLYFSDLDKNKTFLYEKTNKFFNITYYISEVILSGKLGKEPKRVFNNDIEEFVYEMIKRKPKYVSASLRSIKFLLNFL